MGVRRRLLQVRWTINQNFHENKIIKKEDLQNVEFTTRCGYERERRGLRIPREPRHRIQIRMLQRKETQSLPSTRGLHVGSRQRQSGRIQNLQDELRPERFRQLVSHGRLLDGPGKSA